MLGCDPEVEAEDRGGEGEGEESVEWVVTNVKDLTTIRLESWLCMVATGIRMNGPFIRMVMPQDEFQG